MKLQQHRELATRAGVAPLLEEGAIITSPDGRRRLRVVRIRGSTVTCEPIVPWQVRAAARAARGAAAIARFLRIRRPARPIKPGIGLPVPPEGTPGEVTDVNKRTVPGMRK